MPDPLPHLRADAHDNRERVLESARELFAESGLGVPMRAVARRAGVGPATLYRRFPTKQDLVGAAFEAELRECREIVERGAADPDPWRGFRSVVIGASELNARNHAFVEAFTSEFPDALDFAGHRGELLRILAGLAQRAKAAGALRPDFSLDDLVIVLLAGRGVSRVPVATRLAAARRFAEIATDGLRASR
ncbi:MULTISPECIES: TetR/AcrR family transcriptional regulator [unclassified Curtobacterium]|uniref:TetR/AcrR family transcriptional regulator n=1 Tax=unclassified Curtobacterium TaxID=257496 RepID=UPI003806ACD2